MGFLLTTRIGSEVCILLWPISWSFMFVLMCGWEEKWGSCSPPGLVMKFALFCDHQRDAKCDTFWELRYFLSPQGNGLGGLRLPKSLYISWVLSNFYGTEIKIWAGFGPIGNTEKNGGMIVSIFWGFFFMFSWGKKGFLKYYIIRTKKLHKMNVKNKKTNS